MGINVSLVDGSTMKESALWDSVRYSGDREFGRIAAAGGIKNLKENPDYYVDDVNPWRPLSVDGFRSAMPEDFPNPDRFNLLADILASDENLWIYESY